MIFLLFWEETIICLYKISIVFTLNYKELLERPVICMEELQPVMLPLFFATCKTTSATDHSYSMGTHHMRIYLHTL